MINFDGPAQTIIIVNMSSFSNKGLKMEINALWPSSPR